ncbi:MAG: hypothetical protein A2036_02730 [Omnitrophica bacterium GWA2_50_21]|nr:MAG: hypothetical protein A2036_02730 [Omnitrophica bacterium GWA2_50_21]
MSKLTRNKIIAKLERLSEYLGYLKEIQKVNKKSFLADYHFYGLAERYLQLSIEGIIDAGKLLIISQGLRKPEDNQDIFTVLCEAKIISRKREDDLVGIANFRNILVHDYEKIDRGIVYEKLHENLRQFKAFQKDILVFLKKR